jgi:isocitrate dehydrogenase kinase/phosphatase
MLCSISKDDKNQDIYKQMVVLMTTKLNRIINSKDSKADINELMKDWYTKVLTKTKDHELALRMTRMIPSVIFNVITKDNAKIMPIMSKGLDMNRLAELSALSIDEKAGIGTWRMS